MNFDPRMMISIKGRGLCLYKYCSPCMTPKNNNFKPEIIRFKVAPFFPKTGINL